MWPWPRVPHGRGRKRRKVSPEQQQKNMEVQVEKTLTDEFLQRVRQDPHLRDQAIAKKWGFTVEKPRESSPLEKMRETLLTKYAEGAEELINADPEMQQRLRMRIVEQILDEPFAEDGKRRGAGRLSEIVSELDEFEELADRLGLKGSGDFMKDMAVSFMQILPQILPTLTGQGQGGSIPKYIVLQEDGSIIEMGPQQYMKLLQDRKLQIGAHQPPPKPEPVASPPKEPEFPPRFMPPTPPGLVPEAHLPEEPLQEKPEEEEMPEIPKEEQSFVINVGQTTEEMPTGEHSLRLTDYWEPFLVGEPDEWIDDLMGKKDMGDEDAKFILAFLSNTEIEGIIETLQGFTTDVSVGQLAQRIIAARSWLESAREYLKTIEAI